MAADNGIPDDHAVLAAAFDAIGSDAAWQGFLDAFKRHFNSVSAQMLAFSRAPTPRAVMGRFCGPYEQATYDIYRERYLPNDPGVGHMIANPGKASSPTTFYGDGLSPERARESYRGRDAYHEFFRPLDVDWVMGLRLNPFSGVSKTNFDLILGLTRHEAAGDYSSAELQAIERLAPLIGRAVDLHLRFSELELAAAQSRGVFESHADGVVLVDKDALVHYANPAARRIVASEDGLIIRRGVLAAAAAEDSRSLHRAIHAAAMFARVDGAPGGEIAVRRRSGQRAYQVSVTPPARSEIGFGLVAGGLAAVVITDPEVQPPTPAAELRRRFNLTQGELDVALALSRGLTIAACGEQRGVSINTVRTLLKRAMEKTGSTRQSQLVAIVLGRMLPVE